MNSKAKTAGKKNMQVHGTSSTERDKWPFSPKRTKKIYIWFFEIIFLLKTLFFFYDNFMNW